MAKPETIRKRRQRLAAKAPELVGDGPRHGRGALHPCRKPTCACATDDSAPPRPLFLSRHNARRGSDSHGFDPPDMITEVRRWSANY